MAKPDLKFRTLTTEHFLVHYHVGEEEVADHVAMLAERAYYADLDGAQITIDRDTETSAMEPPTRSVTR
ncbi:hypothetical protein [Enhygromyxa salina]|uniref:Uncharacterized protein n=1 Tax=Enhygromyxa salina TaxID=215803 RepID=A0A2S9XLD6_9BACT|nr:hypothetical protein [Enhygromyxa salina]PRP93698.1 hypothetical protein ENSA7_81260 [Enhygromyxa salina]